MLCSPFQAFIENYPQFRKLSGTTTKHVAVVGELSRKVESNKLMVLSEVEQDIVTGTDRAAAFKVREESQGNFVFSEHVHQYCFVC